MNAATFWHRIYEDEEKQRPCIEPKSTSLFSFLDKTELAYTYIVANMVVQIIESHFRRPETGLVIGLYHVTHVNKRYMSDISTRKIDNAISDRA